MEKIFTWYFEQIGLPTNSELNSSPNAVFVNAYTKDDGTQVRTHWRSKPEGGIIANQIQNGISIPSYNDGIFGDLNKETFSNFDSGIFGNVNNTNIPTFDNGGEVENNGVDVNNQNLQNAIAPILLPMILSQIPMPNMQTQQNVPTGYASDIDTSQINNYVGNETATPVYAENGVLKGNIAENVNFGKNNNVLQTIFNDYKGLEDPMNTILYAIGAFLTNYFELKDADTKKADKYFHARANYEAAQQGIVGSITAKIISDLRELSDSYRNINEKKY